MVTVFCDAQCLLVAQWPGYQSKDYQVSQLRVHYRDRAEVQGFSCEPSIGANRPEISSCTSSP